MIWEPQTPRTPGSWSPLAPTAQPPGYFLAHQAAGPPPHLQMEKPSFGGMRLPAQGQRQRAGLCTQVSEGAPSTCPASLLLRSGNGRATAARWPAKQRQGCGRTQLQCCRSSTERFSPSASQAAGGHSEPQCPHPGPRVLAPPLAGHQPLLLPVCSGQQAVWILFLLRLGLVLPPGARPEIGVPRLASSAWSPLTDLRAGVGPRPLASAPRPYRINGSK